MPALGKTQLKGLSFETTLIKNIISKKNATASAVMNGGRNMANPL